MASSITGHSTWESLNRLARPNHSMAVSAAGDRFVDCCFVHDHPDEQFGSFPFRVCKIFRAIQTEQPGEVRVIPLRQELHAPAQRGGGETKRRERVPHVVLAIAEGPFTVFPRLAPGDGGQPDMKSDPIGYFLVSTIFVSLAFALGLV